MNSLALVNFKMGSGSTPAAAAVDTPLVLIDLRNVKGVRRRGTEALSMLAAREGWAAGLARTAITCRRRLRQGRKSSLQDADMQSSPSVYGETHESHQTTMPKEILLNLPGMKPLPNKSLAGKV